MRLRHAAALALVGWYLMIPPKSGKDASGPYDPKAELNKWFVFGAYDFAHECEGAKFLDREAHKSKSDPMNPALESAQCIATDDPRLKSQ